MRNLSLLKLAVITSALFASGCMEKSSLDFDPKNRSGAPFNASLSKEYTELSTKDSNTYNHSIEAQHFAIKSLRASEGEMVLPEALEEWDLKKHDLPQLVDSRQRLLMALEHGARYIDPQLAARTQVSFDCMVAEHEHSSATHDHSANICQKSFMDQLKKLEDLLFHNGTVLSIQFKPKSINLSPEALTTIKDVAERAKKFQDRKIMLVGHTDPVGKASKNLNLSHGRLMGIKDALIAGGVPAHAIKMTASRMKFKADKKVVEPRHHAVDIYLY